MAALMVLADFGVVAVCARGRRQHWPNFTVIQADGAIEMDAHIEQIDSTRTRFAPAV
jgi:hypothetical protein